MDAVTPARRIAAATALLALVLTAAGCGSANKSASAKTADGQAAAEPVAWASTFCGGLGEVIASADEMGAAPSDSQEHKESLLDFADTLQRSLEGTAGKLERLGAPDVPGGAQTQQIVLDFFGSAAEATATQRDELAALDAEAVDFDQRLGEIVTSGAAAELDGRMAEVTSKPELMSAYQQAPECRQMAR